MRKILWNSIYREYDNNRLFDEKSCKIGQNLLLPNIKLKENLMKLGVVIDTFDLRKEDENLIIINDLSEIYYYCCNLKEKIKYILKRKGKYDALKYGVKNNKKMILIISEPSIICPKSYNKKYHKYFDKIFTWDDDIVDNKKYFKYQIPQPFITDIKPLSFNQKKFMVNISSNKISSYLGELYSKRLEFIKYAENNSIELDVFGYGWNSDIKNYKGTTDDKLKTLSMYKYSLCFENIRLNGYITEKIFDCFFSGTIPVYLGAPNINEYVPKDCFIDASKFENKKELFDYLRNLKEEDYNFYISNIVKYLNGEQFKKFSMDYYVDFFSNCIINELK